MDKNHGWIKIDRGIVNSKIYTLPPLYWRVFERMILEANHKEKIIPFNGSTVLVKRGERITSIRQIAGWVAWYEKGILRTPNPKTIKSILRWLENESIKIIKNPINNQTHPQSNSQYTHYKIINYDCYQPPGDDESNAESNSQVTAGKQSLDTNKNEKNEKNIRAYDNSPKQENPEDDVAMSILLHWNGKEGVVRHRVKENFLPAVRGALKQYKLEEIKESIDNYARVLKDNRFYWSYKWSLDQFLKGIDQFLPDNFDERSFYCQEYREHLNNKKQSNIL